MVQFSPTGYTIIVETGCCSIEEWKELQDEILMVLMCFKVDSYRMPYRLIKLLLDMQPDLSVANKMLD